MGSRKRRRERDLSRRQRRSYSRSSSGSHSRSRSPIAPPPPTISNRRSRDRDRDEKEDRHHRYNKHKDSTKSRKHHHRDRSRERSRSRSAGRSRRSKHEPENQSDSSDCVEVPLPPPAPVISKPAAKSSSPIPENGAGDSLSIEETNKLRAKLGLKPLQVNSNDGDSSTSKKKTNAEGQQMHKDEWGEFYHKPANNLSEKLQAEKLREKFRQNKEKRAMEKKLKSIKKLGESDSDDDVSKWVDSSREKEKMKADAQRRAKILEEMDNEFGVGELVQEETRRQKKKIYSETHLKGLKVDHDLDTFTEGKSVILTLKDKGVLDEDDGDTLMNVNMVDDERYRKNIENKRLNPNQYGYNVFDEEVDEFGNPIDRGILGKYDEEIDGKKKKKTFTLGQNVEQEIAQKRRLQEIKSKLAGKRLETLNEPLIAPATDTYTESELATFKKPKKKIKKLRKKLKAEDLEPLPTDSGALDHRKRDPNRHLSDVLDTDDVNFSDLKEEIKIEDEDNELEQILSKARRLKQVEAVKTMSLDVSKIKAEVKAEADSDDESGSNDFITLNQTAEFCRTLGDIPTYGQSGNRGVDANEIMDLDSEHEDAAEPMEEDEPTTGTWNSVNPDLELKPIEKSLEVAEVAILDEEPDVSAGMGAALKLALSKGYLEKEETNRPSNTRMAHLLAQNYSIEDKAHGEDDKFNRRDRYHGGPSSDFKDKDNYKPNVKLEYIDDSGRLLNEKEAFRYLSHKFHGKGPGKNKIEKRLKKVEQDGLMMKMSSTDTPLGTLTMLQHKQKETHSPFIVLSGSKQAHGTTTITKHK